VLPKKNLTLTYSGVESWDVVGAPLNAGTMTLVYRALIFDGKVVPCGWSGCANLTPFRFLETNFNTSLQFTIACDQMATRYTALWRGLPNCVPTPDDFFIRISYPPQIGDTGLMAQRSDCNPLNLHFVGIPDPTRPDFTITL
jgi:hypothetical protein